MVDQLDEDAIRIVEVEGSRPIPMGLGCLRQRDPLAFEVGSPKVDVGWRRNGETHVVEDLRRSGIAVGRKLVQCQVVGSKREVYVFWIGPPLQLHAQYVTVECQRSIDVPNVQSNMPESD